MLAEALPSGSTLSQLFSVLQQAIVLFPLLLSAAFFSGTETALFSLSIAQRESLRQSSQTPVADATSSRILWLLSDPRRLITTLILGNEITNILLSEVMTDLTTRVMRLLPATWTARFGHSSDLVIALCATLVTVPVLVTFGELIPKTIGIKLNERWAGFISRPATLLTWIFTPARLLISALSSAVLLLLGQRTSTEQHAPVLSEKQFRTLVDLGSAEGEIEHTEAKLIHNVLDFGDRTVGEIMTPARKVYSISHDLAIGRVVESVTRQRFSRVPVYRGRKDHIVGILFAKDLVGPAISAPGRTTLADLLHPPLFVPRRAKCDRVFREFQRRKTHLALVVDEYGRLAGVVTMEDLLDSLLGDVMHNMDAADQPAAAVDSAAGDVVPPPAGDDRP